MSTFLGLIPAGINCWNDQNNPTEPSALFSLGFPPPLGMCQNSPWLSLRLHLHLIFCLIFQAFLSMTKLSGHLSCLKDVKKPSRQLLHCNNTLGQSNLSCFAGGDNPGKPRTLDEPRDPTSLPAAPSELLGRAQSLLEQKQLFTFYFQARMSCLAGLWLRTQ